MGGEEETLAWPLARAGWEMRYVDDVVVHHEPSLANVASLRSHGNAIVYDSSNPYHRVWELLSEPESSRRRVTVESR